jgi:hypothetical protein
MNGAEAQMPKDIKRVRERDVCTPKRVALPAIPLAEPSSSAGEKSMLGATFRYMFRAGIHDLAKAPERIDPRMIRFQAVR